MPPPDTQSATITRLVTQMTVVAASAHAERFAPRGDGGA